MPASLSDIVASDRLPSLPQLALRVIELARQPEPDFAEVIRTVRTDPALSSKMLKTANSALLGLRHPVQNIESAIPMLGMTMVRTIVLGFTLASGRRGGPDIQRPLQKLWRSSLTQAVFAELIAEETPGADPPTYFLAGLLQDIGILAALHTTADDYLTHVWDNSDFPNVVAAERQYFHFTHQEVSCQLCQSWGLPDALCEAVGAHHRRLHPGVSSAARPLTRALQAANLCAQYVENLHRQGDRDFDDLVAFLTEHHAWDLEKTEDALRDTIMRVGEAAAIYSFDVGSGLSTERILDDAKRMLEEIALNSQLESMAATRYQAQQAGDNAPDQATLEDEVMRDAMTGVYNRRFMDRVLHERLARDIRGQHPMGLLFLDIDRFKSINDTRGHQVGDKAIREVARIVSRAVRKSDFVIRYGGDEFLVALLRVDPADVQRIAERIRVGIDDARLEGLQDLHFTTSVGAVHYQPQVDDAPDADWLVAYVDQAMYEAKRNGGNQVRLYRMSGACDLCIDGSTTGSTASNSTASSPLSGSTVAGACSA